MRPTLRLLANVKPWYLEPFTPTRLTGLTTHPSPRLTLIFLYRSALGKLKHFPKSSIYHQSVEALTRHHLQIVKSTKPPGYEQWLECVRKTVGAEPERFVSLCMVDGLYAASQKADGSDNPRGEDWDGESLEATTEGPHCTAEQEAEWHNVIKELTSEAHKSDFFEEAMKWENKPALEAEQVSDIEHKISAGLLEEVIQVAEGELKLIDEMYKGQVWEELEEKPAPGQWNYFKRE